MSINYKKTDKFQLVTLILPEHSANDTLKKVAKSGARNFVQLDARGTILSENNAWYTRMFPPPSPKQAIYQTIVPDESLDSFMSEVATAGQLNISGNGAIYATPCNDLVYSDEFPVWEAPENRQGHETDPDAKKLVGISCIVERAAAEPIAKGAILSGAPGPTVFFAEGRGLRDKIRLLRICKTAEKEVVNVVVEDCDVDHVFREMSREGRITEPGRGFIYTYPVTKGLINILSTDSGQRFSASMQEIITAIDEIKGGKEWRGYNPLDQKNKQEAAQEKFLENLVCLTTVVERDHSDTVLDAILGAGAPAASASHGRVVDCAQLSEGGSHINKEWSLVVAILAPNLVDKIRDAIMSAASEAKADGVCIYSYPVNKAQTYLGG